jgi:hypothetical protein
MTTKETFKTWGLIVGCIVLFSILVVGFVHVFGPVFLVVFCVVMLIALFVTLKKS